MKLRREFDKLMIFFCERPALYSGDEKFIESSKWLSAFNEGIKFCEPTKRAPLDNFYLWICGQYSIYDSGWPWYKIILYVSKCDKKAYQLLMRKYAEFSLVADSIDAQKLHKNLLDNMLEVRGQEWWSPSDG